MKILLIGPQGSGKSTQADLLADYLKVPKITVGDIFRKIAQEENDLGERIRQILAQGQLVDDVTTSRIVKERLEESDCQNGFVLDGYPRTLEQARIFDPGFNKVFYLKLDREKVLERLLKRGRDDDTEELIKTRLNLYYNQTQPLLDYYENRGNLVEVNGEDSIEEVFERIKSYLN